MSTPPLDGYRVVDLSSGIAGGYATKILADGGADVVKVEDPEGDPLRRWSASGADIGSDDGALFQFLAASKRSLVADPERDDDRELVLGLVAAAEAVVWSPESRLAARPELNPAALHQRAPHATVCAISPFGLDGPWAGRPATAVTIGALTGGPGTQRGAVEDPPVPAGGQLEAWTAGIFGAIGVLASRARTLATGVGEIVDVSVLEAAVLTQTMHAVTFQSVVGFPMRMRRLAMLPGIHPTKDGYVGFMVVTGQQWQDFCSLVERTDWLEDESLIRMETRNGRRPELVGPIDAWMAARTTHEVVEMASLFRIPVAEVGTGASVPQMDHFVDQGFFVPNPRGGFLQPEVPYTLHGDTERRPFASAPRVGEHSDALRSEAAKTAGASEAPPAATTGVDPARRPLEGLRVADFSQFWAGPIVGNILGMLGADVIKVESAKRPDGMRFNTVKPMTEDGWWEWSPMFQGPNTDKRDLTLDLGRDTGQALARRLVAESDVVLENFSPRVMESWGLDYESLRAVRPDVIMVRMPAFGLSGPWRDRVGYAQTMEQISGLGWITGYPDKSPEIPNGPCDPIGGTHATIALLLALEHRHRTGEGMLVECPQVGGALNVAAELVIEHSAYGALLERQGARGPVSAPQGVYRSADVDHEGQHDKWVAIAVPTDAAWAALRSALGDPAWTTGSELDTAEGRRAAHDAIDRELAAWCESRSSTEIVEALSGAGVPAEPILLAFEQKDIDQLWHRGFFEELDHPVTGRNVHSTLPLRFGQGPSPVHTLPAPTLGQHNRDVLSGLLGLSDDEIATLEADGVIGTRVGTAKAW